MLNSKEKCYQLIHIYSQFCYYMVIYCNLILAPNSFWEIKLIDNFNFFFVRIYTFF